MASNDDDWVADVRRWYFDEREAAAAAVPPTTDLDAAIGYETAHPGLQAHLQGMSATDEARR